MIDKIIACFLLIFVMTSALAQAYDDCNSAYIISNPTDYCSGKSEFTLVGSKPSGFKNSTCYGTATSVSDIWMKFEAQKVAVNVVVNGKAIDNTLKNPQVTFYSGDCTLLNDIYCGTDENNDGVETFTINNLVIGETYFIRVSDRFNSPGNFQLCVTNFNPPVLAGQDCATASRLCDKSSFLVGVLTGSGNVANEGINTCLDAGVGVNSENRSTWYKWTADKAGTLTFDITSLDSKDDIDFVLYEIPSINSCVSKSALRCVATYNSVVSTNDCGSATTGLRLGELDDNEGSSCSPGQNNYVRQLSMLSGKSYALLINNDSKTGTTGFKISFGGSGTFLGPSAVFNATPDPICPSKFNISYVNAGTAGQKYTWDFGKDASIKTANTVGPFDIEYITPGDKSIILTVESSEGCKVTNIIKVNAKTCCKDVVKLGINTISPKCFNDKNGEIIASATGVNTPYTYAISNGTFGNISTFGNLDKGFYKVVVQDNIGCRDSLSVEVKNPEQIVVKAMRDTIIPAGTTVLLTAVYSPIRAGDVVLWSPNTGIISPSILNTLVTPLETTKYTVTVTNQQGCTGTASVNITTTCNPQKLPIIKANGVPPLCNGTSTGKINLNISGENPPFLISVSNTPFIPNGQISMVPAGRFVIRVKDNKNCLDSTLVILPDPPKINVIAGPDQIVNFPDSFGLSAVYNPINAGDSISWSPSGNLSNADKLVTRGFTDVDQSYVFTIKSSDGCIAKDTVKITVKVDCTALPSPKLQLMSNNPSCANLNNGSIIAKGDLQLKPFTFAIGNGAFQSDSIFKNLAAGSYKITIKNSKGCTKTDSIILVSPEALIVLAGDDQKISLGDSILLDGNYSPQNSDDSILWTPIIGIENPYILSTNAIPQGNTNYILTITTADNCVFSDTLVVNTIKTIELRAPNIFKPDLGTKKNGYFKVTPSKSVSQLLLVDIFDRWGNKVYHIQNVNFLDDNFLGWNGKFNGDDAPTGVYVWIAKVKLISNEEKTLSGNVTLIR